ncbi:hypothetical protein BASA81_008693 [Batrachochytrium salamandrivorans]|nr:hypothetical protein BASA81_008693 [Batrachochytrium salamandrivorans]
MLWLLWEIESATVAATAAVGGLLLFLVARSWKGNGEDKARKQQELLLQAKQLLAPSTSSSASSKVNRAMQALNVLVEAARMESGQEGANELLSRGRALFREREGRDRAELDREEVLARLEQEPSMLAERGKEGLLAAALQDGSSVVCRKCSGLVKRERWEAHCSLWCPALDDDNSG